MSTSSPDLRSAAPGPGAPCAATATVGRGMDARLLAPETGAAAGRDWIARLSAQGPDRDAAVAELHGMLVRAARFEIRRRWAGAPHPGDEREDLAQQSADDALAAILCRLDEFRGLSRFTTWAYKFALYEAAANMRRRSWRGREVPFEDEALALFADRRSDLQGDVEMGELLAVLADAIASELTPHQHEVLVALALNEVPIDVLAERLSTTRGALYKSLHDARAKLRALLAARGMSPAPRREGESR